MKGAEATERQRGRAGEAEGSGEGEPRSGVWAAEEWGETGVSLRILCPHPSAPRGVWLPGSPCVTALSGAAAEKQQKGDANEPQLPARTPGSRGAARRGCSGSCLENPMDRGGWQATVHGVAKSWTQLKQLNNNKRVHL